MSALTFSGLTRAARAFPGRIVRALPEPIGLALTPNAPYAMTDIPAPVALPAAPVRLYVGPANFAGQGYSWARAAHQLPGVGASNMAFEAAGGFAFDADEHVPAAVYARSTSWQRRQRAFVNRFTHVLVEAELPLFGRGEVEREVRDLRARGIAVGFVCHGSDIRLPSRHAQNNKWSPFADGAFAPTVELERVATQRRAILTRLGGPIFVSTPDLLLDVPEATWLPVVVDPARWAAPEPAFARPIPKIVHAPSRPWLKGTDEIEPALEDLARRGLIEYQRIDGVPSADMPGIYACADIVLDQFRLGSYGVSACEAMASGRLVVGHISDQVRHHVATTSGLALPIVEATIESLPHVLERVLADRSAYAKIAASGPAFVASTHDGTASAQVLAPFLGVE